MFTVRSRVKVLTGCKDRKSPRIRSRRSNLLHYTRVTPFVKLSPPAVRISATTGGLISLWSPLPQPRWNTVTQLCMSTTYYRP